MTTSAHPARHFDAAAAHEAIDARAEVELLRLRALCRRIGITPDRVRQWKVENQDPPY